LQQTTAVGIYPQGNSLQSVADLSGNVWEWCLNTYEEPANTQKVGSFARVVRGGSWDVSQGIARASYRYYGSPDSRYYSFGFRVSPPSEHCPLNRCASSGRFFAIDNLKF
jgi:formylglycine-generating enzyme required for sulfatase activity